MVTLAGIESLTRIASQFELAGRKCTQLQTAFRASSMSRIALESKQFQSVRAMQSALALPPIESPQLAPVRFDRPMPSVSAFDQGLIRPRREHCECCDGAQTQVAKCPPKQRIPKGANREMVTAQLSGELSKETKSRLQIIEESILNQVTPQLPPLTQRQLAARIGTSRSTLSRIFKDDANRQHKELFDAIQHPDSLLFWRDSPRSFRPCVS